MENSGILRIKSKFFLIRVLSYFSFLLLPIWLQRGIELNLAGQCLLMTVYILFMVSQWFLLGKEIDHRLKIYFKVNSSLDRVIYRLMLGKIALVLYFLGLSLIPAHLVKHFFWGTWVVLGIFYSWPTRGKIVRETVTSELAEFRYLDSFEKTVLFLILLLFLFSLPELPVLNSTEALKLYFDSSELISEQYWTFMKLHYFPFLKRPELLKVGWCLHFYVIGMGLFLLTFYAILRFFFARRLSILGVFALISSWSYSKILGVKLGVSLPMSFSILWVWALIWIPKSSTYRLGLFIGLLGYLGTIINNNYYLLILLQWSLLYLFLPKDKTYWYKRQFFKYSIFGIAISTMTFLFRIDENTLFNPLDWNVYIPQVLKILDRKAFFSLCFPGVILFIVRSVSKRANILSGPHIDLSLINQFLTVFCSLAVYSILFEGTLVEYFSIMWILTFFSLIPIEWIFQSISRLRSRRNMIFGVYAIICLLDSHFEGRVKIFLKLFS
ncbi:MAG: hypothetical protein HOE90_00890 [Bacteriovoracaceae bacterium]|nr:hypothetical protein [Bacteriovoracaceae bacterium]